MSDEHGSEEQEGFGQADLGEGQSSNPPADPDMLEDPEGDEAEETVIDPDAGIDADQTDA